MNATRRKALEAARARITKLAAFQGYKIQPDPALLRIRDGGPGTHAYGQAGYNDGYVAVETNCPMYRAEQTIIHEWCHLIMAKNGYGKGMERVSWHGTKFQRLLLAACVEWFALDYDQVVYHWQVFIRRQDERWNRWAASGRPTRMKKRIRAYLLDDAVLAVIRSAKGIPSGNIRKENNNV